MQHPVSLARRSRRGRVAAALLAKAIPNLLIGAAIPAVFFLLGRSLWGLAGGAALSLAWNGSCQLGRRLMGKPYSGLLIVGLLEGAARTAVAIALHSAQAYFIAPSIVTAAIGLMFVRSGFTATPLTARVVAELVPSSLVDLANPTVARLMRWGSLLYGTEQVLVALLSLAMVVNLSTTTYVAVHPVASWAMLGLMMVLALPFFRADVRTILRSRTGLEPHTVPATV
jgi:hypothetical protein